MVHQKLNKNSNCCKKMYTRVHCCPNLSWCQGASPAPREQSSGSPWPFYYLRYCSDRCRPPLSCHPEKRAPPLRRARLPPGVTEPRCSQPRDSAGYAPPWAPRRAHCSVRAATPVRAPSRSQRHCSPAAGAAILAAPTGSVPRSPSTTRLYRPMSSSTRQVGASSWPREGWQSAQHPQYPQRQPPCQHSSCPRHPTSPPSSAYKCLPSPSLPSQTISRSTWSSRPSHDERSADQDS
mmetsp:Transcript_14610/g.41626  ORF Transcript_14610/g.41626 Transcript_14610/m.41626 type:complete len:236 (+) Transcript_14610:1462-2169(+)